MINEIKKDITVNDGKGLMDNEGMIDSLIVNVNDLTKLLTSGQYVGYCNLIVSIVQKLATLKKGVMGEIRNRDEQIADLKRNIEEMMNIAEKKKEDNDETKPEVQ